MKVEKQVKMAYICMDCGCDDIRNFPDMGLCCNNCASKNFRMFDRLNIDEQARKLLDKYKMDLKV